MKKIYNKPVVEIESFVTDEVMIGEYNPENVLSYNSVLGTGGYAEGNFINFQDAEHNNRMLNSIDYKDFK